jgi:uncharacterized protein (DUF4415 family)
MTNTAKRRKPPKDFDENPAWTEADFARAKPLDAVDPAFAEALKRGPGRPKVEKPKKAISLRLDPDAIAAFQATGKGWQSRLNAVVVKAAKKLHATR